jgi:translation initiation factor IF-3
MANITPDPNKRGCDLPPGCKDLMDVLNLSKAKSAWLAKAKVRVNGNIQATQVRVVGIDGKQLGVMSLAAAPEKARSAGVDLIEVAPNSHPPICRIFDYGQYCYEQKRKAGN